MNMQFVLVQGFSLCIAHYAWSLSPSPPWRAKLSSRQGRHVPTALQLKGTHRSQRCLLLTTGQQTALEIGKHPEAGHSANTNCYWRQRLCGLLRCYLELTTYRSASLVTVWSDISQAPESLLVSSPKLAHLRTIYFALYKCTHYYYYCY